VIIWRSWQAATQPRHTQTRENSDNFHFIAHEVLPCHPANVGKLPRVDSFMMASSDRWLGRGCSQLLYFNMMHEYNRGKRWDTVHDSILPVAPVIGQPKPHYPCFAREQLFRMNKGRISAVAIPYLGKVLQSLQRIRREESQGL